MSLILLVTNVLETSTVTATSEQTPATRLYDRDPSTPWKATTNAQQDILADQGASPLSFSYLGLIGYSVNTDIQVHSGGTNPPTNLRATIVSAAGDPRLVSLGGSFSDRYVRARILTGGVTPQISELVIGTPYEISENPHLDSQRITAGQVQRTRSLSGRMITTRLGSPIIRLRYSWTDMVDADVAILEAAWSASQEGAKALLVQNVNALAPAAWTAARWCVWVDTELTLQPVGTGTQVAIVLETAA